MKNIKIVYMGTPELSAKIFEGLISEGYNIVALIAPYIYSKSQTLSTL